MVLKFSTEVAEDETISIIQSAIVDGKLGELSVNVSSVIGISAPVEQTTTTTLTSIASKSDDVFQIPSTPVEETTSTTLTSTASKSDDVFQIPSDSGGIDLSACYSLELLF